MSSSSFFSWTYHCIWNSSVRVISSFELALTSRINVFIWFLQLNFTFHLELMSSSSFFSWTYHSISNWCLHFLYLAELIFVSRITVFVVSVLLNLPFYLELISWSAFSSYTYLCIWNSFLSLPSSVWIYLWISNWWLHFHFSAELNFVSRSDVFILFLQLILPLRLEFLSWSSFFI